MKRLAILILATSAVATSSPLMALTYVSGSDPGGVGYGIEPLSSRADTGQGWCAEAATGPTIVLPAGATATMNACSTTTIASTDLCSIGSHSMQLVASGTGGSDFSPWVSISSGHTYTITFLVMWPGTGHYPFVGIEQGDGGTPSGTPTWIAGATADGAIYNISASAPTTWQSFSYTLAATHTQFRFAFELFSGHTVGGVDSCYFDNLKLSEGGSVLSFQDFDGASPLTGWTNTNGTPPVISAAFAPGDLVCLGSDKQFPAASIPFGQTTVGSGLSATKRTGTGTSTATATTTSYTPTDTVTMSATNTGQSGPMNFIPKWTGTSTGTGTATETDTSLGATTWYESGASLVSKKAGLNQIAPQSYSTNSLASTTIQFLKSHDSAVGALTTTLDGEQLGLETTYGVSTTPSATNAGYQKWLQDGNATAAVPGRWQLHLFSSGNVDQTTIDCRANNSCIFSGNVIAPNLIRVGSPLSTSAIPKMNYFGGWEMMDSNIFDTGTNILAFVPLQLGMGAFGTVVSQGKAEFCGTGGNCTTIQAPNVNDGWTLTLPPDDGVSGQVLGTDGAGNTAWVANGSGTGIGCSGTCTTGTWAKFVDSTHITNADFTPVPDTRTIATANGLQGGGDLTTNRTLSPVYGSTANTVMQGNDRSWALAPVALNCTHADDVTTVAGAVTACGFGTRTVSFLTATDSAGWSVTSLTPITGASVTWTAVAGETVEIDGVAYMYAGNNSTTACFLSVLMGGLGGPWGQGHPDWASGNYISVSTHNVAIGLSAGSKTATLMASGDGGPCSIPSGTPSARITVKRYPQ